MKKTKSILVEVNDDYKEQKENVEEFLKSINFNQNKKTSSQLSTNTVFKNTYNQIWINNNV